MKISYYFTVMTPMPVALNQLLTEISRVSMVEALQLACLSLSESNRRRISSFFDFLSHVVNNKHLVIASDMMSRSSVSSALNLTMLAYCFFIHYSSKLLKWNGYQEDLSSFPPWRTGRVYQDALILLGCTQKSKLTFQSQSCIWKPSL